MSIFKAHSDTGTMAPYSWVKQELDNSSIRWGREYECGCIYFEITITKKDVIFSESFEYCLDHEQLIQN